MLEKPILYSPLDPMMCMLRIPQLGTQHHISAGGLIIHTLHLGGQHSNTLDSCPKASALANSLIGHSIILGQLNPGEEGL